MFSDVHGNCFALEGMLSQERILDYDEVVFCGDVVGYYPFVGPTLDMLADIGGLVAVRGNHDDLFLGLSEESAIREELVKKYGISYLSHLNKGQMSFLSQLPKRITLEFEGTRIGICHGSWDEPLRGRLYPDTPITAIAPETLSNFDYLFCGHTHYAMEKVVDSFCLINPGSLGQPRDGGGFRYCVVDTKTKMVDFRTVAVSDQKIASLLEREPNESLKKYLLGQNNV